MSKIAIEHWKKQCARKDVKLTSAEKLVLKTICLFHDESIGIAYATVGQIAEESGYKPRWTQCVIGSLEQKLMVRRYEALRSKDGSQTTTEYELVGLENVYDVAARARVFRIARTRKVKQLELGDSLSGAEEPVDPIRVPLSTAEGCGSSEVSDDEFIASMTHTPAGLRCSGNVVDECTPPVQTVCTPPVQTVCTPLNRPETYMKEPPPNPPAFGAAHEEKLSCEGESVGEDNPMTHRTNGAGIQKATTTAKAKAGDVASEAVVSHAKQSGDPGLWPRRAGGALEGPEAAIWFEAARVLRAMGYEPDPHDKRVRRSVHRQVETALRLHHERTGMAVYDIANVAIAQWKLYWSERRLMRFVLGPRKFFSDGVWLDQDRWPWHFERLRHVRGARVGMSSVVN